MNKILLKNISRLITPQGNAPVKGAAMDRPKIFNDAVVAAEGGIITYAGEKRDFAETGFEVLDCAGKAVIPGFVDSHTHLVFGGYREGEFAMRQRGKSYMEIMAAGGGIAATVEATKNASEEELTASALGRIEELKRFGVTYAEIKSGYGLDADTELKQLKVIRKLKDTSGIGIAATFMGAHAVPGRFKGRSGEYIEFIIKEMLPRIKRENLAEFVDVFCERGVFSAPESELLLGAAQRLGFKTKIHADEMACTGGAELAARTGCISADHLLSAGVQGIKDLAKSRTVATLLPLTAFCLKEPYANARALIEAGAAVALATDFNPGSCFSPSVPLLIALAVIYMKMTAAEVVTALTLNGACAIGRGATHGSLEEGKAADMLVLKYPSIDFLAYHTGANCVEKVIRNGKVIAGGAGRPGF